MFTRVRIVRKDGFPAAPDDVVQGHGVVLHDVMVVVGRVVVVVVVVVVCGGGVGRGGAARMASADFLPRFSPPHLKIFSHSGFSWIQLDSIGFSWISGLTIDQPRSISIYQFIDPSSD